MLNKQKYSKPREFIKLKTDPIINEYYNPNGGPGSEIKFETKYKNLVEKTMLKRIRNEMEVRKLKESETITFDYYQTKDDKSENLLISIISRVSPNEGNQSIKSVCIGPKNDPKEETECSNAITNHINQRWAQRQALINRLKALKPPSTDMDWVVRKKTNQDMEMNKLEMKRNIMHKAQQQQEQQKQLNDQQLMKSPQQLSLYQSQQNDKDVSIKICLDDFAPVKPVASYKNIFELESEFGVDKSDKSDEEDKKSPEPTAEEAPAKEMNKLTIRDRKMAEVKNIFSKMSSSSNDDAKKNAAELVAVSPPSPSELENQVVPSIVVIENRPASAEQAPEPEVAAALAEVPVAEVEQVDAATPVEPEVAPVVVPEPVAAVEVEQKANVVPAEAPRAVEVVAAESSFDQIDFSKSLEFKPSSSSTLFNPNSASFNYNYNPLKTDYASFSPSSAFTPPAVHQQQQQQQSGHFSLFKNNSNNNYDYASNSSYLGLSMPNVAPPPITNNVNMKNLNKQKKQQQQQQKNKKQIVRSSSQNSNNTSAAYMVPPYGGFVASDHQLMPNDRSNMYMPPPTMSYNSVGSTNTTTSSQPIDNSFQSLNESPYLIPAIPSMDMGGLYRPQSLYDTTSYGVSTSSQLQATAPPFMSQQQQTAVLNASQQSPVNYNPYQTPNAIIPPPLGANNNNKRVPKQRFESPLNTSNNNDNFNITGKNNFNRAQKFQPNYMNNNNNFNTAPSAPVLSVQPQSNVKQHSQPPPFSIGNFTAADTATKKPFEPIGTFTDTNKGKKFNKKQLAQEPTVPAEEVTAKPKAEEEPIRTGSAAASETAKSQVSSLSSNRVDGEIVIENNSDNDHELSALFESLTNPAYNVSQKPKAIVLHAPKQIRKKFIEQAIAEGGGKPNHKVKLNNFNLPPFGPSLILNPQSNFLTTSSTASYYLAANLPPNLTSLLPQLLQATAAAMHNAEESGGESAGCAVGNNTTNIEPSSDSTAAKSGEEAGDKLLTTETQATTNENKTTKSSFGKSKAAWPKTQTTKNKAENGSQSGGEQTTTQEESKPTMASKVKAFDNKEKNARKTGQKASNKSKQQSAAGKTEEEVKVQRAPSPVLTDAMFPMTLPIKSDFNSPFLFETSKSSAVTAEPAVTADASNDSSAESVWSKRVLWSQIVSNRKLSGASESAVSDNENLKSNEPAKDEEAGEKATTTASKKGKSKKQQQNKAASAVESS